MSLPGGKISLLRHWMVLVYCCTSRKAGLLDGPPSSRSIICVDPNPSIYLFCPGIADFLSILTDHKPLVTSLFRTTPPWLARQQRQLSFIAEFTSNIRHTTGQENVVADALSRPPPAADSTADFSRPHRRGLAGGGPGYTGVAHFGRHRRSHQHHRVSVFPQRPTDHHDWLPATANTAQLSASSINTSGGATAGPLRAGPPGQCAAAAVPGLRLTLPSAGAVNAFLSPRDGQENQQGVHTPPPGSPDTGRHGASQAAT
jgi:hypothetical protein